MGRFVVLIIIQFSTVPDDTGCTSTCTWLRASKPAQVQHQGSQNPYKAGEPLRSSAEKPQTPSSLAAHGL